MTTYIAENTVPIRSAPKVVVKSKAGKAAAAGGVTELFILTWFFTETFTTMDCLYKSVKQLFLVARTPRP